jgi:hypothetical protein
MSLLKEYILEEIDFMLDDSMVVEDEGIFESLDEHFIFEGLINPAFKDGQDFGAFGKLDKEIQRGAVDKDKIMSTIQSLYDKNKKKMISLKNEFANFLKKNSRKFKNQEIYAQIKPLDSLLDKVGNRGKSIMEINDLIRGAVVFDTKDDADKFVADLIRKNKSKVVEVEEKEKGGDPVYGYYGAYHLLVDMDGVYSEVQVMTKNLWKQKKKAHKIYSASRSSSTGPSKQDMQLSKQIFNRGNKVESVEYDDLDDVYEAYKSTKPIETYIEKGKWISSASVPKELTAKIGKIGPSEPIKGVMLIRSSGTQGPVEAVAFKTFITPAKLADMLGVSKSSIFKIRKETILYVDEKLETIVE